MSFLTVLIVVSGCYFAVGRPDASTVVTTTDSSVKDVSASDNALALNIKAEDLQHQVDSLSHDMVKAMEEYIAPLMTQLDDNTQDKLMTLGLDGINSYLNYMIILIKQKGKNAVNDVSQNKDDNVIVKFDELKPMFGPGCTRKAPVYGDSDEESAFESSESQINSSAKSEDYSPPESEYEY